MIATGRGTSKRRRDARSRAPHNGAGRDGAAHDGAAHDTLTSQSESSAAERYEVLERVGEGTLFVVYRVRERATHQIRALKALKGAYSRHERFAPAFSQIAQRVLALRHPNLTPLLEVGKEEGTIYLVEDWLPGGALEARLRRAPFGRIESVLLATHIGAGLEFLHDSGLAHGDLRPRQILFNERGVPCLSDIGFSSAYDFAGLAFPDTHQDATLYTAPERFDGAPPAPSADLYSLGVVLYRVLAGRVPFDGPSPVSIAARHRNDRPLRPTQFNPDCPRELEEAVLRLLEKDPQNRFSSVTEFLDEVAPDRARIDASTATDIGFADRVLLPHGTDADGSAASTSLTDELAVPLPVAPASPTSPTSAPDSPIVEEEEEEEFLSDEERTHRVRIARRKQGRRELLGAFLAFFWMLVFGGALWGVLYGAYHFWMKEAPPEVRVPKYVGLSQDDAKFLLSKWGLQLRVGKEIYNPKKPEGTVLGGSPPPGKRVRKGRIIIVTVSRGEEPIRMVDFAELTLEQARAIITRHGMRLGQISEQYHTRVPKGYVCGQFPEPGETFRRSEPINLIISRGAQPSPEAPAPEALPEPEAPDPESSSAPRLEADDPSTALPPPLPQSNSEETLVPRAAVVSVALPANAGPKEIKILVRDSTGDFTAYQQSHEAGDVVEKTVQVLRPQDGTALVRVYVGGRLIREIRV